MRVNPPIAIVGGLFAIWLVWFAIQVMPEYIWIGIWNMPQGMGALFGAFFGLLGVAVSASIGFRGLQRAQAQRAAHAREQEREKIEREITLVQSAFLGEITTLIIHFEANRLHLRDQMQADDAGRLTLAPGKLGVISKVKVPIYEQYNGKTGVLPANLAARLFTFYSFVDSYNDMAVSSLTTGGHEQRCLWTRVALLRCVQIHEYGSAIADSLAAELGYTLKISLQPESAPRSVEMTTILGFSSAASPQPNTDKPA